MENGYERHHSCIPDETLVALKVKPEQLGAESGPAVPLKPYLGRSNLVGSGGEACRASENVVLTKLADDGADTFRLTEQELQQEQRLV